jgi:radical SAM protein with 4Fe4S-binding SPASM domain
MNFPELLKNAFVAICPRSKSDKHLVKSPVFCMAPWIQLHVQPQGEVTPCCMSAYKGGPVADLRENSDLAAAWNSEKMKHVRLNMIEGKQSSICSNCYSHEKLGKSSDRIQYNRDYANYYDRVKSMLPDGTVGDTTIPVLDIRFSNKCNYKCRICNSSNSSLLYEEDLKLGKIDSGSSKEMKATGDDTIFWKSYKRLLPTAKRLHFAGGEPLFMDEHYEVLEYLISIGNTDVNLSYNTNFSTLRYKRYNIIEIWNKFRKVDVWASLDGMGERGDYQRKGQRWKEIETSIRLIQNQCSAVVFGIDVTVSVLNIFHIPEFYQYMVENKFVHPDRMNLYYLHGPDYFSVTNLTPALKEKAAALYETFISGDLSQVQGFENMKQHSAALIRYMQSDQLHKQEEFKKRILETDTLRNENFTKTFPELSDMMQEHSI